MLDHIDFGSIVSGRLVLVAMPGSNAIISTLRDHGARDVLALTASGSDTYLRHPTHAERRLATLKSISQNNCQVAILNSFTCAALNRKRYFATTRLEKLLVPLNAYLPLALPGTLYYKRRKLITIDGRTTIPLNGERASYLVLGLHRKQSHNRRMYAPIGWEPQRIFDHIKDIDYVLLRGLERIEGRAAHKDIDLLVSDNCLMTLRDLLTEQIGTVHLDVYAESGIEGHDFESVPYFMPQFARKLLASSELRKSGIRAPSPRYRYLALCYHLLFHRKSYHIPPDAKYIDERTFIEPRHYKDLIELAGQANMPVPHTFDDLDQVLRVNEAFPGKDLMGFYARRNPFVAGRYVNRRRLRAGLATFFVRDFFGQGGMLVPTVGESLRQHYVVLADGSVDAENRGTILSKVRGGNWHDESTKQVAEPIHWFVCFDACPTTPAGRLRRKYPNLDNEMTALVKHRIRENGKAISGVARIIHASDNSDEALEHVEAIGVANCPAVAELVANLKTGAIPRA